MAKSLHFVFLLTVCIKFTVCAHDPQPCILQQKGLQDFLREAGISDNKVKTYADMLTRKNIDVNVLKAVTLAKLQILGIHGIGDRMKIQNYFASDMHNNCAKGNVCHNGGVCRDGFRCFLCSCPDTFYGPTCSRKCPCKNWGKCIGKDGGFKCKCMAGYAGSLCEKQWLTDNTFHKLEKKLTKKLKQSEKELKAMLRKSRKHTFHKLEKKLTKKLKQSEKELKTMLRKSRKHGWRIVRVDKELDLLSRIALHQKTPTYIQKMPMTFPKNTKAIIISVFTYFWNRHGHLYLTFKTHQRGNAKDGSVAVKNQHFRIYANTFYYELMLPWDTALPQELVFKITSTYMNGGSNNWYKVKLVGFITDGL